MNGPYAAPSVRRARRLSVLLLAAATLSGCAATSSRLPVAAPPRAIDALVATLSDRADSLRSVDARFQIDLRIDGIRQKGLGALFWRAGGPLKLDVSDRLLGIGVMSALAGGDSLSAFLPRENRFLHGPAADVLYSLTGVDVSFYSLRGAVLGLPCLPPSDIQRTTQFETRADTLYVKVLEPLWTRRLRFHAPTRVLLEERIYTPGGRLLSTRRMSDYRLEDGVPLPRTIHILQDDDRITLRYSRCSVNTPVPDDRLRLALPSDAADLGRPE